MSAINSTQTRISTHFLQFSPCIMIQSFFFFLLCFDPFHTRTVNFYQVQCALKNNHWCNHPFLTLKSTKPIFLYLQIECTNNYLEYSCIYIILFIKKKIHMANNTKREICPLNQHLRHNIMLSWIFLTILIVGDKFTLQETSIPPPLTHFLGNKKISQPANFRASHN